MATPYDIISMDEVASTQDAATVAFSASGDPVLVVADRQVSGRGRAGRVWLEPDVGMFASVACIPKWPESDFPRIPLAAAVAVRRALATETGLAPDLKWPNDLLIGDRKIGGILVEAAGGRFTAGCGVNLWWAEPPPFAAAVCAGGVDHGLATRLATRWADELLSIVLGPHEGFPLEEYRAACTTIGRRIRWTGGEGVAADVDDGGALIVVDDEGRHRVLAGDVHLLGGG
jgi:BirA family transcriptional regulator, biotin operon repressor / biotin---[acetyl-CoA-carboxylase] ligase